MMRILLVDDHEMLRDGLCALLSREPDIEVVAQARDGEEAVQRALAFQPDVVLMDVLMPVLNGVEATRRLKQALPDTKVICLSGQPGSDQTRAVLEAGAVQCVRKSMPFKDLVQTIRAVSPRASLASPQPANVAQGDASSDTVRHSSPPHQCLAPREREVLTLLAEGLTSKEIATKMNIAVSTVETYRRQIAARLGLHSIAELTRYAVRHGLASLD